MKKMISRRNFLKVCAVAGSAVALSACGGSKKAAGPDPSNTDQTSFDIVGGQSALSPGYNDNEVLKKLADNVGVKLNYETMSDSLSEQVNIRIAGDQLPDAFMGVGFSNYDIANYGADGTFLDLTPYINAEIMPNLTKILDEHPNIRAAITMSDGCIYGLPAAEQMGTAGIGDDEDYSIFTIPQFSMINKRWLDELGLAVPTTLDELHTALKAFKDNDMSAKVYGNAPGSTIPMSTGFDEWWLGSEHLLRRLRIHQLAQRCVQRSGAAEGRQVPLCLRRGQLPQGGHLLPRLVRRGTDGRGDVQSGYQPAAG